ncbi:MAG: lysophospholipid acyltransferase family protein [Bryobacteraceae bacterium]
MSLGFLRALLITDPIIILATAAMGTVSLIVSFFDRDGRAQHRISRQWSRMLLLIGGVDVRIEGLEKIDPAGSYVFVANHTSFMDTPVVLAHIPVQFRFMAKKGLFAFPLLGTHLKRAGHLAVVRGDPRASLRSMEDAARIIRDRGISVLLFPEGGRSHGQLGPFKEGAAYIAIKAGVPVVPVGMLGTLAVLPRGSIQVQRGRVALRIGDPIETAGLTVKDRSALTLVLRERILELTGQTAPKLQNAR